MPADLFPGFTSHWIDTSDGRFFARAGGAEDAPPLVLLHGFPQTHACWHRIAPALARTHRVICLDLKGYGWSAAPKGDPAHEAYSKRQMGREVVAVMERLGHVRFGLVGHDRGARVGYRLALDEPGRIERLARHAQSSSGYCDAIRCTYLARTPCAPLTRPSAMYVACAHKCRAPTTYDRIHPNPKPNRFKSGSPLSTLCSRISTPPAHLPTCAMVFGTS